MFDKVTPEVRTNMAARVPLRRSSAEDVPLVAEISCDVSIGSKFVESRYRHLSRPREVACMRQQPGFELPTSRSRGWVANHWIVNPLNVSTVDAPVCQLWVIVRRKSVPPPVPVETRLVHVNPLTVDAPVCQFSTPPRPQVTTLILSQHVIVTPTAGPRSLRQRLFVLSRQPFILSRRGIYVAKDLTVAIRFKNVPLPKANLLTCTLCSWEIPLVLFDGQWATAWF
ncbi:hypothetical protein Bbelb_162450 [Branchiostoma belcheri]|nr:hypothetical protein Bbelb_162450 [Branchiostoma belcheri]